jgi:hypothetical protein
VASLDILAKLYISRYQYADAAAVYEALATRRQGLGDQQVTLAQRIDLYQSAVLQVAFLSPGTLLIPCSNVPFLSEPICINLPKRAVLQARLLPSACCHPLSSTLYGNLEATCSSA